MPVITAVVSNSLCSQLNLKHFVCCCWWVFFFLLSFPSPVTYIYFSFFACDFMCPLDGCLLLLLLRSQYTCTNAHASTCGGNYIFHIYWRCVRINSGYAFPSMYALAYLVRWFSISASKANTDKSMGIARVCVCVEVNRKSCIYRRLSGNCWQCWMLDACRYVRRNRDHNDKGYKDANANNRRQNKTQVLSSTRTPVVTLATKSHQLKVFVFNHYELYDR